MEAWIVLSNLSHILAIMLIVFAFTGLPIFSAVYDWHDNLKDLLVLGLKVSFIPALEILLSLNSIEVPLTGLLLGFVALQTPKALKGTAQEA